MSDNGRAEIKHQPQPGSQNTGASLQPHVGGKIAMQEMDVLEAGLDCIASSDHADRASIST
jgi:hypothetical protein